MTLNMAFVGGERQINRADPPDTDGDSRVNGLFGVHSPATRAARLQVAIDEVALGRRDIAVDERRDERLDLLTVWHGVLRSDLGYDLGYDIGR